jgi:hypothetical protein
MRFPQTLEVTAQTLPPIHAAANGSTEITGRIQNVSEGGVCLVSALPLKVASFVCCQIAVPDMPVPIPTLMQVRWTTARGNNARHIHGLCFVAN